ncbi:hypothetical protein HMPREF3204_00564 [Gardnerella pickettii]|nr:hypothetical protein HMPREF3204_00564 [Gardnerella pickettii]
MIAKCCDCLAFNMSLVFFVKLENNAILIIHANRLTKGFLQEIRDAR